MGNRIAAGVVHEVCPLVNVRRTRLNSFLPGITLFDISNAVRREDTRDFAH